MSRHASELSVGTSGRPPLVPDSTQDDLLTSDPRVNFDPEVMEKTITPTSMYTSRSDVQAKVLERQKLMNRLVDRPQQSRAYSIIRQREMLMGLRRPSQTEHLETSLHPRPPPGPPSVGYRTTMFKKDFDLKRKPDSPDIVKKTIPDHM